MTLEPATVGSSEEFVYLCNKEREVEFGHTIAFDMHSGKPLWTMESPILIVLASFLLVATTALIDHLQL